MNSLCSTNVPVRVRCASANSEMQIPMRGFWQAGNANIGFRKEVRHTPSGDEWSLGVPFQHKFNVVLILSVVCVLATFQVLRADFDSVDVF